MQQHQRKVFTPVADGDSPEGHAIFTKFRPAIYCPFVFFTKDTDPVASAEADLVTIL
jgi:hypothetical protein